ncbi:hemerythrin domain-containing protein [Sphingobium aromaticiconvertens]|uniref:hemerythrin domain-containing protein n=1 Tax=Sphingobium aromaticiconvertens TaxID=365341 RepID=UPI003017297E
MDVSELKWQHDEIGRAAGALVAAVANPGQHQPIAALRWELARLLMTHLAMEDRLFYPAMQRLPNAEARATATAFQAEMGGLSDAFGTYMRNWTDDRVTAEWPAFCAETQTLLRTLAQRIERENSELYPLAARSESRRKAG